MTMAVYSLNIGLVVVRGSAVPLYLIKYIVTGYWEPKNLWYAPAVVVKCDAPAIV